MESRLLSPILSHFFRNFVPLDILITHAHHARLPLFSQATLEQFRRVANLYFLVIGGIMAVGYYTTAFESAISPWTTLGPLAMVISISLLQEGLADLNRHKSDDVSNNSPCVILNRSDNIAHHGGTREKTLLKGKDIAVSLDKSYDHPTIHGKSDLTAPPHVCKIAFEHVKRMNIRQGHLVLIRNREMIPADVIILASSSDNGNAYIETSSIDGETNLKLRSSPHLPDTTTTQVINGDEQENASLRETLEEATKRVVRFSALAFPHGLSALANPENANGGQDEEDDHPRSAPASGFNLVEKGKSMAKLVKDGAMAGVGAAHDLLQSSSDHHFRTGDDGQDMAGTHYVAALKSEPPNASVNTFSGSFTLPPTSAGGPSIVVPLNADNILLRGAVLRNTEWAIGLAVFTGTDTKLVRNSFETPSKFSQLDKLMNQTVVYIVIIMITCIAYLATLSTITIEREFDNMW